MKENLSPKGVFGNKKDVCVCILAHNEQKHIAATIKSIIDGNKAVDFDVIVYANGCTDGTVEIVQSLFATYPNLRLRVLKKASKTLAWNTAFNENTTPFIIFSDGDVQPEPETVAALCSCMGSYSEITIASCQYWPQKKRMSFEQEITGLMQVPLVQDFLTGCFYGVRREALHAEFQRHSLPGIPDGIVGEDFFLSSLVPARNFTVIEKKCYYEPPTIEDYKKYLARIRWQEKQVYSVHAGCLDSSTGRKRTLSTIIKQKKPYYQGIGRLCQGIMAAAMRHAFICIYKKQISRYYESFGSVVRDGESILSKATRSNSTK